MQNHETPLCRRYGNATYKLKKKSSEVAAKIGMALVNGAVSEASQGSQSRRPGWVRSLSYSVNTRFSFMRFQSRNAAFQASDIQTDETRRLPNASRLQMPSRSEASGRASLQWQHSRR